MEIRNTTNSCCSRRQARVCDIKLLKLKLLTSCKCVAQDCRSYAGVDSENLRCLSRGNVCFSVKLVYKVWKYALLPRSLHTECWSALYLTKIPLKEGVRWCYIYVLLGLVMIQINLKLVFHFAFFLYFLWVGITLNCKTSKIRFPDVKKIKIPVYCDLRIFILGKVVLKIYWILVNAAVPNRLLFLLYYR